MTRAPEYLASHACVPVSVSTVISLRAPRAARSSHMRNHSIINFYAAYNHTLIMSACKSHRQLAVESGDDATSDSLSVIKKYSFHEAMAAVSVLKDITADRSRDEILHSMFNIEVKLQDSNAKIKCTGQQSSINSFFKLLVCDIHFEKNMFLLKYFFYLIVHNYLIN